MRRLRLEMRAFFHRRARRHPSILSGRVFTAILASILAVAASGHDRAVAGHVDLPPGMSAAAPLPKAGWLVSDWPAGQSTVAVWNPANVHEADGVLELVLDNSGTDKRPFAGAEVQSLRAAETGTWRWFAQAPQMVDGAVFGMFLYRADDAHDPWREYDMEFVGANTRQLQLNIIFEDRRGGRRVRLTHAPVIVDLGFDASAAPHLYEIEVGPRSAEFRVDGKVVGSFGPEDIKGGIWNAGPLHGYVDLWPAAPGMSEWAGRWRYTGTPLVARIHAMSVPQGED